MNTKTCTSCELEKPYTEFSKNNSTKDKLQYHCKLCVKNRGIKFRQDNPDYNKNYYKKHKEELSKVKKIKYQIDKDTIKLQSQKYYNSNKTKILHTKKEYLKIYRKLNKTKIAKYKSQYNKNRRNSDPMFRLKANLRSYLSNHIKHKNKLTTYYLGCSYDEFKTYIESKFEPWMTWNNYGNPKDGVLEPNKTWDLDHIIPIASAKTEDELIKLCYYTNYQPLCSYINRIIKRDK